jgi:hypothetical protein
MKQALMNEVLTKTFFAAAKRDEKNVLAAFVARNSENALKSKPRVSFLFFSPSVILRQQWDNIN